MCNTYVLHMYYTKSTTYVLQVWNNWWCITFKYILPVWVWTEVWPAESAWQFGRCPLLCLLPSWHTYYRLHRTTQSTVLHIYNSNNNQSVQVIDSTWHYPVSTGYNQHRTITSEYGIIDNTTQYTVSTCYRQHNTIMSQYML